MAVVRLHRQEQKAISIDSAREHAARAALAILQTHSDLPIALLEQQPWQEALALAGPGTAP
ncbi:hypothetical protein [Acidithiobacillus sp. AMEEHan]|uniref:hypothetical protein n=1 Tax=Acidithiobacillus sp. AMEEHan TaxID=2994951 RepID=UPI0027E5040A|nr:hypothetical protein [Acidithiobacillus sp. AMEEHan]